MRSASAACLLLLAGACAVATVGAARSHSDAETQQLQGELRSLSKDIVATDATATTALPVLARVLALASEITTGKYKEAAAELLMSSAGLRAAHGGNADCDAVQKSFTKGAQNLIPSMMTQGDCSFSSMADLSGAALTGSTTLTGDALKTRVLKMCSMEGPASDTSCGETGPLAVLTKLSRKWAGAKGLDACSFGSGNSTLKMSDVMAVGIYSDLICAKEGSDYCMVKTGGLTSFSASMASGMTKEGLTQMCSPCTLTQFRILARILGMMAQGEGKKDEQNPFKSLTSMLKGMCATDKDESFCALQPNIMIMMTQNNPAMTPPPGTSGKNYAAMCSFCGRKIMGSYMGLNPDRSERKKMSDQMVQSCFKKEDMDKFCGDFVESGNPNWAKVKSDCNIPEGTVPENPTCSATCKPTIAAMKTEWGCCTATVAKGISPALNTYMGNLYTACEQKKGLTCKAGLARRFKAKVRNLNEAWTRANPDNLALVSELIGAECSEIFSVYAGLVSVNASAMSSGGTELAINMETTSEEESNALKAAFQKLFPTSRRASKASFESLELVPVGAKIDPEAKMTVEVDPVLADGVSTMFPVSETKAISGSSFVHHASMTVILSALVLGLFGRQE